MVPRLTSRHISSSTSGIITHARTSSPSSAIQFPLFFSCVILLHCSPALVLFIRAAAVAVAMCRTCCSLFYRSPPLHSLSPIRTCYAHTYSRTTHDNRPYKHHRHHARKRLFTASAARPKSLYTPILRFTPAQPRGVVKSQFAVILDNIGLYVFFSQPYLIYVCRLITSKLQMVLAYTVSVYMLL